MTVVKVGMLVLRDRKGRSDTIETEKRGCSSLFKYLIETRISRVGIINQEPKISHQVCKFTV